LARAPSFLPPSPHSSLPLTAFKATTDDGVIVVVTVLLRTIFVKSTPKTSDKKATNGDCHTMLKVIQHGMTIGKFQSDHSQRLQINQKMTTMEEGDY
jgi:hypothetical protein